MDKFWTGTQVIEAAVEAALDCVMSATSLSAELQIL